MKAMILAAGEGTRLLPLTQIRPKPLFPIYNSPLLRITIEQLKKSDIKDIVINTHHLNQAIENYLKTNKPAGINIALSHEVDLLGTGGAVKKVADFWDDSPFILINGDIIHTIDITAAYQSHLDQGNLATLILHDYPPYNRVEIEEGKTIVGIRGKKVREPVATTSMLAFTGIHILSPRILEYIPPHNYVDIIDLYLDLISRGAKIGGLPVEKHYWLDIGTPSDYHRIHRDIHFNKKNLRDTYGFSTTGKEAICPGMKIILDGYVSLGHNIKIGKNSIIKNSILWNEVNIGENLTIDGCIIADGVTVRHSIKDEIIIR